MLKRLIHFAMIGCLLGCPPSCWLKSAIAGLGSSSTSETGRSMARSHEGGCRCCCHKAPPARTHAADQNDGEHSFHLFSDPAPCDDHGTPSGPCQCICGGATLVGHVAFDAGDALHFVDQFTLANAAFDHAAAELIASEHWRVPDDEVLSGREICRLHSLMLC